MNRNYVFLAGLIALACISCNKEAGTNEKDDKPADVRLSVIAPGADAASSGDRIVFTEEDIESYNGQSRRISFQALSCRDLVQRAGAHSRLAFCLGDEVLFEAFFVQGNPDASYDEPVLMVSCGDEFIADKFYLYDGFPYAGQEGFAERNPGWAKFISYLAEAGKLDDTAEPVSPPPTPPGLVRIIERVTESDIQTFNPASGQIVFDGFAPADYNEGRMGFASTLSFYLGETLLFEALVVSPVDSRKYDELTFMCLGDTFYLRGEAILLERVLGWEPFIHYLAEAGKLDDTAPTVVVPPAPGEPAVKDSSQLVLPQPVARTGPGLP